jgi:hypothetical protein
MFFPWRNCGGVFDLSTQVLTEVFFMIFSIFQACTEECDSNTQVCNKYSLCFSSERNLYQEFEGQVTGHWNFLPLNKSFKVLD